MKSSPLITDQERIDALWNASEMQVGHTSDGGAYKALLMSAKVLIEMNSVLPSAFTDTPTGEVKQALLGQIDLALEAEKSGLPRKRLPRDMNELAAALQGAPSSQVVQADIADGTVQDRSADKQK